MGRATIRANPKLLAECLGKSEEDALKLSDTSLDLLHDRIFLLPEAYRVLGCELVQPFGQFEYWIPVESARIPDSSSEAWEIMPVYTRDDTSPAEYRLTELKWNGQQLPLD